MMSGGLVFVLPSAHSPTHLPPTISPMRRRRGCAVEGQWPSAGDLYIALIPSIDDGLARLENRNEKNISETTTILLLVAQSSHCTTTPLFMANHFVSLFSLQFSSSLSRSYSFIVHCSLPLSSSLPGPAPAHHHSTSLLHHDDPFLAPYRTRDRVIPGLKSSPSCSLSIDPPLRAPRAP